MTKERERETDDHFREKYLFFPTVQQFFPEYRRCQLHFSNPQHDTSRHCLHLNTECDNRNESRSLRLAYFRSWKINSGSFNLQHDPYLIKYSFSNKILKMNTNLFSVSFQQITQNCKSKCMHHYETASRKYNNILAKNFQKPLML